MSEFMRGYLRRTNFVNRGNFFFADLHSNLDRQTHSCRSMNTRGVKIWQTLHLSHSQPRLVTFEVEIATKNPFSGQDTRNPFCNKEDLTPAA